MPLKQTMSCSQITLFVVFVIFQRFETHHKGKLENGSYKHYFDAVFDESFDVTVHGLHVELALQEPSDAEAISSGLALQASLSMREYFRESKGMCELVCRNASICAYMSYSSQHQVW